MNRLIDENKNQEETMGIGKQKRLYNFNKRCFDIIFSSFILIIGFPLIILGALAVKLTSRGPALYHAKRAGLNGRLMDMLKLRTMYVGTDSVNRRITDSDDNRFTPVGKFLRIFKIDELPQFWNVIKGDMSIIGPRPEDWNIVEENYTPEYRLTLDVRPGISSLAAISWYPDFIYHDPPPSGVSNQNWYLDRHLPLQISEAFRYMEKQSLLFDLKMVWLTFYYVIKYSWITPKKKILSLDSKR